MVSTLGWIVIANPIPWKQSLAVPPNSLANLINVLSEGLNQAVAF